MTAKDYKDACRNPVAATNAAMFAALLPIHAIAMYAFLTKFSTAFNPNQLKANVRQKMRVSRFAGKKV
jgi:hypothetical protein